MIVGMLIICLCLLLLCNAEFVYLTAIAGTCGFPYVVLNESSQWLNCSNQSLSYSIDVRQASQMKNGTCYLEFNQKEVVPSYPNIWLLIGNTLPNDKQLTSCKGQLFLWSYIGEYLESECIWDNLTCLTNSCIKELCLDFPSCYGRIDNSSNPFLNALWSLLLLCCLPVIFYKCLCSGTRSSKASGHDDVARANDMISERQVKEGVKTYMWP